MRKNLFPKLPLCFSSLFWLILLAAMPHLSAEDDAIDVRRVEFSDVLEEADEDWIQLKFELTANQNPQDDAYNKKFFRNVEVTATLAYESELENYDKDFVFFESKATISVLERGVTRKMYFFLPGDVVKYFELDRRPKFGYLTFRINGFELPFSDEYVLEGLNKRLIDGFKKEAQANVGITEGMMLPLQLAPWYATSDVDLKAVPTFVRKEEK